MAVDAWHMLPILDLRERAQDPNADESRGDCPRASSQTVE